MRAVDLLGGTEVISREDCLQLLGQESVGRLGVVVDGQVEILPVNYGMDGDSIVFCTNAGRKLTGILTGEATFEVDGFERSDRAGWSVVVHGPSENITSARRPSLEHTADPWTGPKDFLVRITPRSITGRRVLPRP
jgi:uncharacterized protein